MKVYKVFEQKMYAFVSPLIDATTYCMIDGDEALLIDAGYSQELYEFIAEMRIRKVTVLLTHGHYDHMLGVFDIKNYCDVCVNCLELGSEVLRNPKKNLTAVANIIQRLGKMEFHKKVAPISLEPDATLQNGEIFKWHGFGFKVIYTPGHSVDSVCFLLDDKFLFAGDTLVLTGEPEFRYPGGDRQIYDDYTRPILRALPKDLMVFPGHGEAFWISEIER